MTITRPRTPLPPRTAPYEKGALVQACFHRVQAAIVNWSLMAWTKLARIAELPVGTVMEVERGDDLVAVCNVGGELRAMDGRCPHHGGPLGEGVLNGGQVTCPWHMWEFDSLTGECGFNPRVKVAVYPVRVEGADILVDLP